MTDLIPVNIVIADRTYRLKLASEDEELVRKTTKIINDKIIEFKTNFAGKDMQDYVSMVLLWFATEQNKTGGAQLVQQHQIQEALQAMENQIDKAVSSAQ
ncbi:MAG: cell division protein ZapA [Bacteroidetes bacterium]|nr:cell division protein ZapA [Bacteroidota bacterium]MBS1590913.1 cell division protein ZapA [Bacteroidota bacterium]